MYLYFDSKGTLLETINDEALRQYNKGVNTVNVFIENADDKDSGLMLNNIIALNYWFELPTGETLKNGYSVNRDDLKRKTIPFDRNRDLKYFRYGKTYEFFEITLPSADLKQVQTGADDVVQFVSSNGVFNNGGLALMTIQAGFATVENSEIVDRWLSLERVAFTVEDAVLLPDDTVTGSEFNWLLQKCALGDYLRAQLVYTKVDVINSDHAFTVVGEKYSVDLEFGLFNRYPKAADVFLYVYTNASGTNIALATVDEVRGQVVSCSFLRSNSVSIKGEKGNTGNTGMTPNITASATVDANVGTPSVSVTRTGMKENPNFAFAFKNIKGKTGTTPNITASASVDSAVGTPSVSVSRTGSNEYPNLAFAFKNLRGKDGITPNITATASIDANTGTPEVSVSRTGSNEYPNLEFDFKNLKGVDALWCKEWQEHALTLRIAFSDLSRVPVKGEYLTVNTYGISTGDVYIQRFKCYNVDYTDNAADFESVHEGYRLNGPQGLRGNTGLEALYAKSEETLTGSTQPEVGVLYSFDLSHFNRTPIEGENVWQYFVSPGVNNRSLYACNCTVASVRTSNNFVALRVDAFYSLKGERGFEGDKGDKGETIKSIVASNPTQNDSYTETTITVTTSDDNKSMFKVAAKNGTDGSQGPTGKDALVCTQMVQTILDDEQWIDSEYFNRTPQIGESCVVYSKQKRYAIYKVTSKRTYATGDVVYVCALSSDIINTEGATGASGVGIDSANVESTTANEDYTITKIKIQKTDGTYSELEIKAKNGLNNPNTVSYIGTALVDDWKDSTTYSIYGYKYSALLPFTGGAYATDTYVPDVVPSIVADIASGNFAPFANSTAAGVEVYAKAKPTVNTNFNVSLSHVQ